MCLADPTFFPGTGGLEFAEEGGRRAESGGVCRSQHPRLVAFRAERRLAVENDSLESSFSWLLDWPERGLHLCVAGLEPKPDPVPMQPPCCTRCGGVFIAHL